MKGYTQGNEGVNTTNLASKISQTNLVTNMVNDNATRLPSPLIPEAALGASSKRGQESRVEPLKS